MCVIFTQPGSAPPAMSARIHPRFEPRLSQERRCVLSTNATPTAHVEI